MDDRRFDDLARLFGAGFDRRKVLRGLLGGAGALAALTAPRPGNAQADPSPASCPDCPDGESCCDATEQCYDPAVTCCTSADCTGPCSSCVAGSCTPYADYCQDTQQCYDPADGGCCSGDDCTSGFCEDGRCIEALCASDADCAICSNCINGFCVAVARYCQDTDTCYNPAVGECCSIDDCPVGSCIDGVCVEVCQQASDCAADCTLCDGGICVNYGRLCQETGVCYSLSRRECCTNSECASGTCEDGYCLQTCFTDTECGACSNCINGYCVAVARYCPNTDTCYNPAAGGCCTSDQCDVGSCLDGVCVEVCQSSADCDGECSFCEGGICTSYERYCPETGVCYSPTRRECCTNSECASGSCEDGYCLQTCFTDTECGVCSNCINGYCVAVARYCRETDSCYNPFVGECCRSADCADGVCIDGLCTAGCDSDRPCTEPCTSCVDGACTPYAEYCQETQQCYNTMEGECCYDNQCGDGYCDDGDCKECPPGYEYCPDTGTCYTPRTGGCCTDPQCDGGYCVDNACQECPRGWLYCNGSKSCYDPDESCCTDSDCDRYPGGECVDGDCCYPRCDGKGGPCTHDGQCCDGLICREGVCVRPHKPHPPSGGDSGTVTTLPATGAGPGNGSSAFGFSLVTGAAALVAARLLRRDPGNAGEDA